jgi:hypothetical protein
VGLIRPVLGNLGGRAHGKQGEKFMPVGMFRSDEGWVQVDYGTGNIPIPRSKYEENRYKPDFDKLPSESEYWAAEKKKDRAAILVSALSTAP